MDLAPSTRVPPCQRINWAMRSLIILVFVLSCAHPVNAQNAKRYHALPQIVAGAGWGSTLLVSSTTNPRSTGGVTSCDFEIFNVPLQSFEPMDDPFSAAIESGEGFDIEGIISLYERGSIFEWSTRPDGANVRSGWMSMSCNAPVTAQVIYSHTGPDGITGMASILSPEGTTYQQIPILPDGDTGVAIANLGPSSTGCHLRLEHGGQFTHSDTPPFRTVEIVLSARSNWTFVLSDLFTEDLTGKKLGILCFWNNVYAIGLYSRWPLFTTLPFSVLE